MKLNFVFRLNLCIHKIVFLDFKILRQKMKRVKLIRKIHSKTHHLNRLTRHEIAFNGGLHFAAKCIKPHQFQIT